MSIVFGYTSEVEAISLTAGLAAGQYVGGDELRRRVVVLLVLARHDNIRVSQGIENFFRFSIVLVSWRQTKVLKVNPVGLERLPRHLALLIIAEPLDYMPTIMTVSFERRTGRKDGPALTAGILAFVPSLLMLLAFFGGVKHEAVAADVGAAKGVDLCKVRAFGYKVTFRRSRGLLG